MSISCSHIMTMVYLQELITKIKNKTATEWFLNSEFSFSLTGCSTKTR